jgi:hypothetical protein
MAILAVENKKISQLEKHINYIEEEYTKLEQYKKELVISKKRIEDTVTEKGLFD